MAPSSGGFGGPAMKRLNIGDAVHDGWTAFCRAPWSFVFFALLLTGLQILLQPLQEQVLRGARGETLGLLDWLLFLVAFTASLAVSCWGNVGMVRGAWRALAGERPTLGSMLRWDGPGFRRVFMAWIALSSLLLIPLLVVLAVLAGALGVAWLLERGGLQITDASLGLPLLLIGLLVILLLGLMLVALLYFGVNQQCIAQIALLENRGAMATVQRGRSLVDPQWLLLLLLAVIKLLLLAVGLVTFGMGLMVAWPVTSCISTAAYRHLVKAEAG
jgi:uncharacterized membrane protein